MHLIKYILASVISFNLFAQDFAKDTVQLEEVVITHSKVPISVRQTSKVIQVISKQAIENSTSQDLAQVLQSQAGLVVTGSYRNFGAEKSTRLRGLSSQYALILIDGLPLNDPSSLPGANFDIRTLPLGNIERIEILKGNQSTLYGTDAIAGVINIITTKSKPTQVFKPSAQVSGGSFGTLKAHANVSGLKEIVDYQLSFNYHRTDGISEAKDSIGSQNFNRDGLEQFGGQAHLGLQLNNRIRIEPFFRYTDFKGNFDDAAFTDGTNDYKIILLNTGFKTELNLENNPIVLNYAFTDTKREFRFQNVGTNTSPYRGKLHNIDLFSNSEVNQNLQVLAGLNLQNNRASDLGTTNIDEAVTIFSPYLNILGQDLAGFQLELGGRYNRHDLYGSNWVYNTSAAYQYQNHKLFATYSSGFKAPNLFELKSIFGNSNLKPQKSRSLEVGWQGAFFQDRFKVQTAYFKTKIEDVVVFRLDRNQFANQNEQLTEGLEVALELALDQFYLKTNYSLLLIEIERSSNLRLPKHTVSANLGYQRTTWNLNLEAQYLTERFDLPFLPGLPPQTVKLDNYLLLNLHGAYKINDLLKVFVDVQNLINQDFTEVYGYSTLPLSIYGGLRFAF